MGKDILLGADDDLQMKSGDFVTGEALKQNQRRLLKDDPGDWKQNPTVGIGLYSFLDDEADSEDLFFAIREQFKADGMNVREIKVTDTGKIQIDAV